MRAPLRLAALVVSFFAILACWQSPDRRAADLIEDLRSPDAAAVDRAVRQLVEMGEPAVPALIDALKDPEVRVRNAISTAFSVGKASASSSELVCSELVLPSTAASA